MILKKSLLTQFLAFTVFLLFGSISQLAANELSDQEITNAVNSGTAIKRLKFKVLTPLFHQFVKYFDFHKF